MGLGVGSKLVCCYQKLKLICEENRGLFRMDSFHADKKQKNKNPSTANQSRCRTTDYRNKGTVSCYQ